MIKVRQIKIEVGDTLTKKDISKKLKTQEENILSYEIIKESLDARDKEKIYFVYEVYVTLKDENKIHFTNDIIKEEKITYQYHLTGTKKETPIIIGSGPAGLFAAYILAENGFKPIVIERGSNIDERVKKVETFWKEGKLDPNSNVQFGLGGAGTFSDGKLNTLIKDKEKRGLKVFETFIKYGADEEIKYSHKPHIGTDKLRIVIKNMVEDMQKMGVTFYFDSCLTDIKIENNALKEIEINHEKKIKTNLLILALGHSARDTFYMLNHHNIKMESKPFAVGFRIEHPQSMIDESQYGTKYTKQLKKASYKLTYQATNKRGVYSFCMCPGGYVVNASSEEGMLAINGMSNHDRDSKNANSALVVTVSKEDYGENLFDGIEFVRKLEKKAYNLAKGKIPVQTVKDFMDNKTTTTLGSVEVLTKGEYELSNLNELLPKELIKSLKEAIPYFGKKIKGFDRKDAILLGIESRTSSPIRIIRNDTLESNIKGIYPIGEGAGYAGGITSAAIDGIKVAEEIGKIYKP